MRQAHATDRGRCAEFEKRYRARDRRRSDGADLTAEDHKNLNGGVEKILSKSAYSREQLFEEVHTLVAQIVRRDRRHSEADSND